MEAGTPRHPIGLIVTDDLRRSRLTVFFRLLLVIPHYIWLEIWGIALVVTVPVSWLVALFTGRVPKGLHDFDAAYVRYATRVSAYFFQLANPWPPVLVGRSLPGRRAHRRARETERWLTVFFRLILADSGGHPRLRVSALTYTIVAVLGWFLLPRTRTDEREDAARSISAWMRRCDSADVWLRQLLLTDKYPSPERGADRVRCASSVAHRHD